MPSTALITADHAHEKELADDDGPRERRDAATVKTRSLLVDLRAAVEAAYGDRGLPLLGLGDAIPVDPSVLATATGKVLKALEDASIKLPKPRRAGLKLDRSAFAEELGAELPALQKALQKVAKEDREKEATQRAKNEAMAARRHRGEGAALGKEAGADGSRGGRRHRSTARGSDTRRRWMSGEGRDERLNRAFSAREA